MTEFGPTVQPSVRQRVVVALLVGALAGLFATALAIRPGAVPDLLYPLTAARFLLDGVSPYTAMPGDPTAPPPFNAPFFYPLTTVVALLPLAKLPTHLAVGIFMALSSGLLAFAITRDAIWRLHVFASAPFVMALALGQFSPLLTVAALLPWAGGLVALKPNLGLAVLARRPTRVAIASCVVFGVVSLAVQPTWPMEWLHGLRGEAGRGRVHEIPLLQPGGWLLALGVLALRRADGRLLGVLSAVPQALFFYDQLPLWLVARTRGQSILLTASSQLALLLWWLLRETGDSVVRSAYPYVIALIYLPALALVLRNGKRAPDDEFGARKNLGEQGSEGGDLPRP